MNHDHGKNDAQCILADYTDYTAEPTIIPETSTIYETPMNQSPAPTNRRQTSFRCKGRLGKITLPTDGVTVLRTDCTTEVRRRLSYSHF